MYVNDIRGSNGFRELLPSDPMQKNERSVTRKEGRRCELIQLFKEDCLIAITKQAR
jgi:hypothetical protein